jgi:hypothetical protein
VTLSNCGFLVRTAPEAAIGSWISVVNKSLISPVRTKAAYFKEVLIDVNLVLSLTPRPFTMAMIASEMPAAISPYSMAVAPVHPQGIFESGSSHIFTGKLKD